MSEPELFAFEVPSVAGKFRIVGPDTLSPDEAEKVGALIHRLIPLLVVEPEAADPETRPCPACAAPLTPDDTHWSLFSGIAGGWACPEPVA